MAKKSNNQESKQRILDAALDVFFEVGFEGARVSEIAKRAQVNQALIYYYFKSKEELLTELIKINMDEMIGFKDQLMKTVDISDEDGFKEYINQSVAAFKDKKKILSILLDEILKNSSSENVNKGFEFLSPMLEDGKKRALSLGGDPKVIDKGIISGFFFGMMPVVIYMTIGEKFADYYGIDKTYLEQTFEKSFNEFYVKNIIKVLKNI